jgi:hypothetical protein
MIVQPYKVYTKGMGVGGVGAYSNFSRRCNSMMGKEDLTMGKEGKMGSSRSNLPPYDLISDAGTDMMATLLTCGEMGKTGLAITAYLP